MLVQSHKALSGGEEDHVEGNVSVQCGGESKVETSQSSLLYDCCEGLFAYVGQHHSSFRRATYIATHYLLKHLY